ncbi:alpha/beta hydrolase [Streptomyces longispororuber]|uniref:alpha/beta hydrolase n=1 Tax=Streptomyces longispororuber TaxID=68230 RepID=UPI00210A5C4A|nr:alpha/beta-hydrolase family protein [Streptomyces longispororuber]MCQ4208365.1 alpha/beta hydrolase [Streptomyces longispororuber]
MAAAFYCLSLTPSLLPRAWWLQGIAAGVTAVLGYAVGAILQATTQGMVRRAGLLPSSGRRRWTQRVLAALAVGAVVVMTAWSVRWQGDVRRAVSMTPEVVWWQWALVPLVAALLALLLLGAARTVRLATRVVANAAGVHVPRPAAYAIGITLVALVGIGFAQGFLLNRVLGIVESAASLTDQGTTEGIVQPDLSTLSGSPHSAAAWDTLGAKGRDFIGEAARRADIEAFTGRSAKDPVRVYVGLRSADTLQERADLAVRELERTGGFARKVLAVMGTTGTGWINEQGSKPLEYMWGGDSALVAMQYSYLPSWVSALTEDEAADAGAALFDAVHDKWLTLPEESRPQLLVYGESLGSYAMENALGGSPAALTSKVDGALFVGPTYSNPLWNRVTDDRQPGSPQWRPVFDDGVSVRFAQVPADYAVPDTRWGRPRAVYLQNGSDPVVWWSPGLGFHEPDWLHTPRARDVSPAMRWYPLVTFWQVACDLAGAAEVPEGYGHRYGAMPTSAWAEITGPPDWTEADSDRLARRLTS